MGKYNWADKSYNKLKDLNPLSPEAAGVSWKDSFSPKKSEKLKLKLKQVKSK